MIWRSSWSSVVVNQWLSRVVEALLISGDDWLWKTKTKTSTSTLSNIWKDRNITWATKIRVIKALVSPIALYGCETGCRKGRQESNISLWDVVLEKAAWDIIDRPFHQWTHTVPHWQIPIANYQDWSAQAKILWSCLQKGRRPLWKKKSLFKAPLKESLETRHL